MITETLSKKAFQNQSMGAYHWSTADTQFQASYCKKIKPNQTPKQNKKGATSSKSVFKTSLNSSSVI